MRTQRGSRVSRARHSRRSIAVISATIITTAVVTFPATTQVHAASTSGIITTFAGGGYGDNLPARQGRLNFETGQIAEDSSGNVYIADTNDNLIRKISAGADGVVGGPNDTDDVISIVAGTSTLDPSAFSPYSPPNGGYGGDGGPATAARLWQPQGVAIDASGDIYVGDTRNERVRFACEKSGGCAVPTGAGGGSKGTVATGTIVTLAGNGTGCSAQPCGDGGPATSAEVAPLGIAVDAAGNVYIAEGSHVRFVCVQATTCTTTAGQVANGDIATVAGGGPCPSNGTGSGDGGPATSACLQIADYIALDAGLRAGPAGGTLYISSTSCCTNASSSVRAVDKTGTITSLAAACGCFGDDFGPQQIALDLSGTSVDVAVSSLNTVLQINLATQAVTTLAGTGTAGYTGDGGAATSAELAFPVGLTLDSAGMLIGDTSNYVVRRVATNGVITSVAGTGSPTFAGDGGPPTSAGLGNPNDVAVDVAGDTFIADTGDNRVRLVHSGVISTIAGNGAKGYGGDGGPGVAAELNAPSGVAVDPGGNVYIADRGNNVVRFVCMQSAGCSSSAGAVPSRGIVTVAGNGTEGYAGDGGAATAAELVPRSVAVDRAGNVYVSDEDGSQPNHEFVRRVSPAGVITTAVGLSGAASETGNGGPATSAGITPTGIAVDSAGNLYIADQTEVRFVCFELTACSNWAGTVQPGNIVAVAGGGTGPADGAPAIGANLPVVDAVAVDGAGNVYLTAESNLSAYAVCGQTGGCGAYTESMAYGGITLFAGGVNFNNPLGDGGPANLAEIVPGGIAADPAGNVDITHLAASPWGSFVRQVADPLGMAAYATPSLAEFGHQQVGAAATAQTVTLTNPTSATLRVGTASIAGVNASDFAITSDQCSGKHVASGASCTVQVAFTPSAFGRRSATLAFADSGSTSPQSVTLFGLADSTKVAVVGTDATLSTKQDNQPFQNLGGSLTASPAVVSVPGAPGSAPMVLYIATRSDGNLNVRSDTQGWQAFGPTGTACLDSPGAAVTPSGGGAYTLTVGCEGSDQALYYAQVPVTAGTLPSIPSGGWTGLGGTLSAGPAVTSVGGQVTFIVTGGGGQLFQRGISTPYTPIDGSCLNRPAAATNATGTTAYLACRGTDSALYLSVNSGSGWGVFRGLGGVLQQAPGVAVTSTTVTVWVEGGDAALYHVTTDLQGSNASAYTKDGGTIQFGAAGAGMIAT